MSFLTKLQSLIDPALKETFEKKAYDPAADRAWVVGRLESTMTQFNATQTTRGGGKKWWALSNGVVAFSPTRRDKMPLVVNGQTTNFIPAERFGDFVAAMIEAVRAGEFDKELAADNTAGTTVKVASKPRAARASSGGAGAGWSEERRRKFAESIAARNAAKAG